ncbi:SpoIIE family protein phosphatase [Streptomyces sp. OUCMDZ-4982]|uniref:SpoIIE family protein phosphatase n=1 Tax=Streptomyces sp. OUCMDZ-4982 TaxID=2973090 RepID=UPI00215BE0A2|nr:SpoIIE family protein phosphatase [Streptomyces sp. OUCMDZ-4982]MCR8947215.1 SpoIIE family protein phosphatase [Streptomyces sp. OUCMDZ-4982]
MTITTGLATREGTVQDNADAARVYRMSTGTIGAAVIDGIGHGPHTSATAPLLAEVAARVTAHRGALAGILNAGLLIADEGHDGEEANAVAVVALVEEAYTRIAWVGDCRAYGWDDTRLRRYSTDQTMGQWVRQYGPPVEIAEHFDDWVRVTLHSATVATTRELDIPDPLVILTSDGVHDQVPEHDMIELIRKHARTPQALADALVAAAQPDKDGYRDDATAIVIRNIRN